MEGTSASVRKGAWTEEEDILLKACIEKYGAGNWHLVPYRADDEVDLIIRLPKLLGNRWTLIAGRLPGRTANDVKNYCINHLPKIKMDPSFNPNPHLKPSNLKHNTKVIKPRPHVLSKKIFPVCSDGYKKFNTPTSIAATPARNNSVSADIGNGNSYCVSKENDEIMWWENLMMNENESIIKVVEENNYGSLGELYLDDQLWNLFNP
ncbi:hypothetical protein GQ457_11G004960 [Hibiscus cannabinus]